MNIPPGNKKLALVSIAALNVTESVPAVSTFAVPFVGVVETTENCPNILEE